MTTAVGEALATKGVEVEEWVDLRFFRPLGMRVVRALAPTRVSADQVTLWCLVVGLLGGHCFLYASPWLDALGFALLVLSDVFDSADGQLARLRGVSTPFGRVLDGIADTTRFTNLYLTVLARLVWHDHWSVPAAATLAVAAGVSHSWQSAAVDCIRHAFLELGVGRGSELDLPEDLDASARVDERGARAPSLLARVARAGYRAYVRRQRWLCPATIRLVRRVRALGTSGRLRDTYRARQRGVVRQCAWLGQNIRWVLIGVPCVLGRPAAFLWATAVPLNVVLLALLAAHERGSADLLAMVSAADAAPAAPEALGSVHAR
jgi:hypothetical protein